MRANTDHAAAAAARATIGERAFTLIELLAVLVVVSVALGIVLPRLPSGSALRVEGAALQVADRLSEARERAILGGRSLRITMANGLGDGVRVERVEIGGVLRPGALALELAADGDALPSRVTLVGDDGTRADVVLPPGMGRAYLARGEER